MDHELNDLKREFLAEAREKVEEMASVLDRAAEQEALDRLAYLAHQLKGSGGSYGYQRISTDAAELEKAVESIAGGNGDSAMPAKLQQYVGSLRSEIDRASAEL